MLVLSRQRDESIIIGDDVEITIVDIRGDKVRLGINAPAHIPVHRREIYDAMKERQGAETGGKGVESLAKRKKQKPDSETKKQEPDSGGKADDGAKQ
ncbi:MAG: carbon storage regulator CsrA [Phycisphaerae bacterium]|nr:carbon storage regulator CsrA [Phycisphaerae bacterium]